MTMSERQKAIERLRKARLAAGMGSHKMLSAIGRAVLPEAVAWTPFSCDVLRNRLIDLLESAWNDGFDDGFASADDWLADHEDAMREHGWVRKEEIDAVRHECSERLDRMANHKGGAMTREEIERRFTYHKPSANKADTHAMIRAMGQRFAELVNIVCPDGREKSLAITNIEQAVMWANAAVAREDKEES